MSDYSYEATLGKISEKAAIFDNSLSKDIIAKNTFFAVTVAKKLKRVVCNVKVVLSA
jgi:hypothetical protein